MNCALFCLAAHSFSWLSPKVALHRKLAHWTQVGRRMCAKSKKKTVKETAPWRLIIYPRKPLGWKCLKGNKQGRLFYQNNRPLVRVVRLERTVSWSQTYVWTFRQNWVALFGTFRHSCGSSLELYWPVYFRHRFRLLGFVWDWILYIKSASDRVYLQQRVLFAAESSSETAPHKQRNKRNDKETAGWLGW